MRLRGTETVLAVDDDPDMLDLLEEVLRPLGYNVLSADSGEKAIEMAAVHQDKIHLLLTDVVLPGIKGQDLAKQLLRICPDVNVLLLSQFPLNVIVEPWAVYVPLLVILTAVRP